MSKITPADAPATRHPPNDPPVSDIRITFLGAAGEVTGSATLVETPRARILVDFGMIQGAAEIERRNAELPPLDAPYLDAVVLTHAHVDHCGRLPMLEPLGFSGRVYCTLPTAELLGPVLHGSARLQSMLAFERIRADADRPGRGAGRRAQPAIPAPLAASPTDAPVELYSSLEVDALLKRIQAINYLEPTQIAKGVTLRFLDAGHVIGSASIELTVDDPSSSSSPRTLVFSGDLGPRSAPLLRAPESPPRADVLVLESTYGDRSHPEAKNTLDGLAAVVAAARRDRSRLIIPTFTLGRAQQLLYRLGQLSRQQRLGVPVYLDSKMALLASEIYAHHPGLLDEASERATRAGDWPLHFPELVYIQSRPDSKRLNHLRGPGIIIAGSGFCHGGPVVHHLAHALWRPECHVLLIGHQPSGTTAHEIAAGFPEVSLSGQLVEVNARIHSLPGFSGHADREGLIAFASGIPTPPKLILLNHGEPTQRQPLAERFRTTLNVDTRTPEPQEVVEL